MFGCSQLKLILFL